MVVENRWTPLKKDPERILLFRSSVYIQVKALENYTLDGMILAFKEFFMVMDAKDPLGLFQWYMTSPSTQA